MDQMVLEAQKWVNSTYKNVKGYQPVKETGVTGWATINSLIMGLQHELGITSLAAAFGPTTQNLFGSTGGIKLGDVNNKVKILQAALYCKGYNPGGITGKYGPGTASALAKVSIDLGVMQEPTSHPGAKPPSLSIVSTKLMQSLLTMDAYILLAGGRPTVRDFQKYLNKTYGHRKNFSYVPCDGHFSRNVQRSLMMALQFEMGMGDDKATGFFGPATRAELKKIGTSASVWAKATYIPLFTGALAANGFGKFSVSSYAELSKHIQSFQKKCELPVSGRADYATWCEVLVSMGDPDRAVDTVDTRFEITDQWAKYLKSLGVTHIARYLDEYNPGPDQNKWFKQLRPAEPQRIIDYGFSLLLFSQLTTASSVSVTGQRGREHAVKTHATAKAHGIPAGATIYFAVDFDATDVDIDSLVLPYFRLVADYMKSQTPRYTVGVYGTRNVCERVVKAGLAVRSYISGISYGWSGNLGFALPDSWAFNQISTRYPEGSQDGFAYDAVVRKKSDVFADPGVKRLDKKSFEVNQLFFDYVDAVYREAVALKVKDPELLTFNYMRRGSYSGVDWDLFLDSEPRREFDILSDRLIQKYKNKFSVVNDSNERKVMIPPPPVYDYKTGSYIDAQHIVAVAMGEYKVRFYTLGTRMSYAGEYTGWAGDLVTLFGEYIQKESSYANPKIFIEDNFGNFSGSSFKYSDLFEDSVGYLIGKALYKKSSAISLMKGYLNSSSIHKNPIAEFYADRFQGSKENLKRASVLILGVGSPDRRALVAMFLTKFDHPPFSPQSELKIDGFMNHFSDKFQLIVGK